MQGTKYLGEQAEMLLDYVETTMRSDTPGLLWYDNEEMSSSIFHYIPLGNKMATPMPLRLCFQAHQSLRGLRRLQSITFRSGFRAAVSRWNSIAIGNPNGYASHVRNSCNLPGTSNDFSGYTAYPYWFPVCAASGFSFRRSSRSSGSQQRQPSTSIFCGSFSF